MTPRNEPPLFASVRDVRKAAKAMPDEFLACRDLRHNWQLARLVEVKGGFERTLWCRSCKTNRHQVLSRSGEILSSSAHDYPVGYLLKGIGRVDVDGRAAMRKESLLRALASGVAQTEIEDIA